MIRFLLRRTALGVVVMWLITIVIFAIFYIAPSDVARTLAGRQATPETIASIKHRLGLDQPLLQQYWDFLRNALHGNLGYDYYHQVAVTSIVRDAFPKTLSIAIGGAIIWLVLGVFNGVISATHPRTIADRSMTFFALFFYSMPTFLLGIFALYLLYYRLTIAGITWFPAGGYVAFGSDPLAWADHLILPWLTVALVSAATYTRLTRTSMLEVLNEDYVRTARSKGLTETRVTVVHGLRSALTPVATQFGIDLGALVGGVIVTESVFGIDGLGRTALQAITQQDEPVIIGIVLLASAAVVVANIAVDAAYAVLDPRVRLH